MIAKTISSGMRWRCSAGTTGMYRYSLALFSVQISSFGVCAIAALVVISRFHVFALSAICASWAYTSAGAHNPGIVVIEASPQSQADVSLAWPGVAVGS